MKWWQRIHRRFFQRPLSAEAGALLQAIAAGGTLKSHRYLDGQKVYRLTVEGEESPVEIEYDLVQELLEQKLLTTNQKFPAATFLLTSKAKAALKDGGQGVQGVADVVHFDT